MSRWDDIMGMLDRGVSDTAIMRKIQGMDSKTLYAYKLAHDGHNAIDSMGKARTKSEVDLIIAMQAVEKELD